VAVALKAAARRARVAALGAAAQKGCARVQTATHQERERRKAGSALEVGSAAAGWWQKAATLATNAVQVVVQPQAAA